MPPRAALEGEDAETGRALRAAEAAHSGAGESSDEARSDGDDERSCATPLRAALGASLAAAALLAATALGRAALLPASPQGASLSSSALAPAAGLRPQAAPGSSDPAAGSPAPLRGADELLSAGFAPVEDVNDTSVAGAENMSLAQASGLEADTQWKHYALDCWSPCGGAGLCEGWCGAQMACCRYKQSTDPYECRGDRFWPSLTYHVCVKAAYTPSPHHGQLRKAPSFTFYLYRAQSAEDNYAFGNVNIANLPGVIWFVSTEVAPFCPRRHGVTRIRRYLITTQASPELFARGMNFGIRYSYDGGKCTGSHVHALGSCNRTWDRFGYVVGCNNFRDLYPYPQIPTGYLDGIWYDMPLEGRCHHATGDFRCTWSYREAGEISLDSLEATAPGRRQCCGGSCTDYWTGSADPARCSWRVRQATKLFARKYPHLPADLPPPKCDFDRERYWDD